jgi:tripartite-type tricarboxylate transporter receptor subunit TctC
MPVVTRRGAASLLGLPLALPVLLAGRRAMAQEGVGDYPNRPVRFISPFPPGQAGDTHARIAAEALGQRWPIRPIVENRPGGAGAIGMEAVARAPADGYTFAYASVGPTNILPVTVPSVPYDPSRDFVAVAVLSVSPVLFVVNPSLPVNTIQEFVAYAREHPLDYASGGPGTIQHMSGELLRHRLGLKLNHVAYRGSGPAVTDTIAGVVKVMVDSLSSAMPHIRSGRLRPLALTGGHGVPALPGIPSIGDSVAPGYDVNGWTGLFAPTGTSPAIIRKVNADIWAGLAPGKDLYQRLEQTGTIIPDPWDPEVAQAFVNRQIVFWRDVIREAGLKIDG